MAENMNLDELKTLAKNDIPDLSKNLTLADIILLVETLNEKDDTLRYKAFLLLQSNSRVFPFVYKYWNELEKKLESENSYQRSLGIMLIAENVRWDKEGKFSRIISKYIGCCNDEKFITARQTIQGLGTISEATDRFDEDIKQGLSKMQFSKYKYNQQKILNKDVANVQKIISSR
jgi:hypothetical protein